MSQSSPRQSRFHGRVGDGQKPCAVPGCDEAGDYRARGDGPDRPDQPPIWRWLCLEHVREFNAGYNYFAGMSADEIFDAQRPIAGWEAESRAFTRADAARSPRWSDFADPLDAIGARFRANMAERAAARAASFRADGTMLSPEDAAALKLLGLDGNADRRAIRRAYAEKLRLYHPDRNGGDRAHEAALGQVVEAYQRLKNSKDFG